MKESSIEVIVNLYLSNQRLTSKKFLRSNSKNKTRRGLRNNRIKIKRLTKINTTRMLMGESCHQLMIDSGSQRFNREISVSNRIAIMGQCQQD
jgi:hypothetical protein